MSEHPENPPQFQSQSSVPGPEIFAPDPEERSWCVAAHLSGLISVFGPLIVWLLRKPQWQALDTAGKEAINFHLTTLIVAVVLTIAGPFTCGIAWIALSLLGVAIIVLTIIATVKTSRGELYRYPLTIRLIK